MPGQVRAFLYAEGHRLRELAAAGKLSGVLVAKILHGLGSPALPYDQWTKCGWWGRLSGVDFGFLVGVADQALQSFQP
jgi:hypothetical protein